MLPSTNRRTPSGVYLSMASRMVRMLPSDFDIFSSPSCRRPLCTQKRENGSGVRKRLGLGDLVLVVREDEVEPAAVDVDLRTEVP